MMSAKEKVALITGSTSGIGESIAHVLASKGYQIVVTGFGTDEQIRSVVEECLKRGSPKVEYCPADLSELNQIETMFENIKEKFGRGPDVLVNNAGIQYVSPVEEFPPEKWDKILTVNLSASFHTIRLAVAGMKERGWGRIINISSAHGLTASVNKSAYCASKHGLIGLTKVVALETAQTGVTCNAICPGWVLTPLTRPQVQAIAVQRQCSFDEAKSILLEKQPTKEFILPEEIGGMVAFLCSDDAKHVTGASLSIDGGWTVK